MAQVESVLLWAIQALPSVHLLAVIPLLVLAVAVVFVVLIAKDVL